MKKLRRVTEAEVIAEFLRNEFYTEEFHRDRHQFELLVTEPDITDEVENALRRSLLFRRRGHMWRELPVDTQWWEVEIGPADLHHFRVFPRAQWRKVADGSFHLLEIVDRIRNWHVNGRNDAFVSKVVSLSFHLRQNATRERAGAILLIGTGDQSPLTIIEGNHRLTAAVLASQELAPRCFRYFVGLSHRMQNSCWYQTNLPNLWHYARNRLKHLLYDPDADITRLLHAPPKEAGRLDAVTARKPMPESK